MFFICSDFNIRELGEYLLKKGKKMTIFTGLKNPLFKKIFLQYRDR